MSSPRRKWNKDKSEEMDKMHRYLAEDGSSDSQLYLALKLIEEAEKESNPSKAELAVEWLTESAKNGNKTAALALEECLQTKTGITEMNKRRVLSCLSRSETEIRSEGMSRALLTTITDAANQMLPQSKFKHRLRRMLHTGMIIKEGPTVNKEEMTITEQVLSYNIQHIMLYSNPLIDLTDDLDHNNLFTLLFQMLQNAFEIIDHFLIVSLLLMFGLSLVFNYIYFKPNAILLYRNLFQMNTIRLSLQFFQVLSFARIMYVINRFNNYKLWVKLLKMVDSEFPSDQAKYFKKTIKPIIVLIIVMAIELNYNQWRPESQPQSEPTLMSSVVRSLMALFSLLTLIRHHTDLIQIFFVVLHFLSRHYLQELQAYVPYFDYYSSDYSLILSIVVVMITTKSILNYVSLNLVIIPNLLVHILISFTDFTTKPLDPISEIIPFNIHLIFGTILVILIMKITGSLKFLCQSIVLSLLITDFYIYFIKDFNYIYYPISVVIMLCLTRRVRRGLTFIGFINTKRLIRIFWFLALLVMLIPLFYTYDKQSSSKVNVMKTLPYDTFYDNCLFQDLSNNITKQIECIDLTLDHKFIALASVASVKVSKVTDNVKQVMDFTTLGLNQYFAYFVSNFYEFSWKDWRIFEYEITFLMQHNQKHISVSLDHLSRDLIDKLKVYDIYEIQFLYDSIRNSAILLSAKCKTCWDVIHWNNTFYV